MTGFPAIAILCAVFVLFPQDSLGADPQGAADPPPRDRSRMPDGRVRVQPRAWEFMPPYGKSDLSTKSARDVERLYDELIQKSPPRGGR